MRIILALGNKLSRLRKENNYTQEQLAEILGVSRQSISKWESDISYPETDKLIHLSNLFGCSLDYLLKENDESNDYYFNRMLSMGIISLGMLSISLIALGMMSLGVLAVGCFALGIFSVGAISVGIIALGGVSVGKFAVGGVAMGKYLAYGGNAKAMIAIGNTKATGSVFEKIGSLSKEEVANVKHLLDVNVPEYLAWAKNIVKAFL